MAKMNLKKFPKQPRKNASIATWQAYGKKVAEIKKYNDAIKAELKKKEQLIANIKKLLNK